MTTVDGVARFWIQAPSSAQTLQVRATCRGTTTARPLALTFRPIARTLAVTARRSATSVQVHVGPVLGVTQGFAADGARVSATVTDANGRVASATAQLADGVSDLFVPADVLSGTLTVRADVLGLHAEQVLP